MHSLAKTTLERMNRMEGDGRFEQRDSTRLRGRMVQNAPDRKLSENPANSTAPACSKSIVEPSEFKLPLGEHEQLFIETCFFARLGFLQPPICLKCCYNQVAAEEKGLPVGSTESCERWTIWRKDATIVFHPEKLEGNLVLVKCNAARRLLRGQRIHGYQWNEQSRALER